MKNHRLTPSPALAKGFAALALVSVVAMAPVLSGCTTAVNTHGQILLPSRVAQIKPGLTTKQDVMQLLGSPSTTGTFTDNRWYYITSVVKDKVLDPNILEKREVLIIDFDKNSVVANVGKVTQADGKAVDPARATTATHGQSMGFLEQAFGNLGFGGK